MGHRYIYRCKQNFSPYLCSNVVYHTHFYFNILSLAAKISPRWLHSHKHRTCSGFIKGILRGVRCTKSLRVLFLHRQPPSWTTLVLYSRAVFIFNEPHLCYSIVSCSPLILIGAHFSSLAINQLHDLSLFKNMMKKRPYSEITAFKNSDPGWISCHNYCFNGEKMYLYINKEQ
jgi:hypothetical protein